MATASSRSRHAGTARAHAGAAAQDPPARWSATSASAATIPIAVQSMTTTKTARRQRHAAADRRADRVRLRHRPGGLPAPGGRRRAARDRQAQPDPGDRRHPLPAQVHLRRDRRRLRRGARKPRQHQGVRRPGQARSPRPPGDAGIPIRIGVNAGSLGQAVHGQVRQGHARGAGRVARCGRRRCSRSTASATSRSASSTTTRSSWSPPTSSWPRSATTRCTSASPRPARRSRAPSSPRSRSARCCREGIGDTIRVSLSAPPVEEVKVGNQILESLNLRPRSLEIVSCPSCGRAQVDVYTLANEVTAGLEGMEVPLRVAVMGCVVNGPGEAREADLGVASGNGKGQIFVKGEVIKTVPGAADRRDA